MLTCVHTALLYLRYCFVIDSSETDWAKGYYVLIFSAVGSEHLALVEAVALSARILFHTGTQEIGLKLGKHIEHTKDMGMWNSIITGHISLLLKPSNSQVITM